MKAVVFDMDGVIFDSEIEVLHCWQEVADRHGIPGIEEAIRECLGVNAAETKKRMLTRYGEEFPYDEYKKESSVLYHERFDGGRLPLKPGIRELLEYLREHEFVIAVASSTRRQVVEQQLLDAGLRPYFAQVVCGDMVARSKPAPDIFQKACELLGVEPKEAIAIEDSYNGIRSAYAAGLIPIMVPDLMPPTEEMEQLAAVIFPSLHEVRVALERGMLDKAISEGAWQ